MHCKSEQHIYIYNEQHCRATEMTICLYDRTMIEKTAHLGNSSCRHFTCNEDIFYGTKVVVATVYDQLKLSGDLRYFAICSKEISVSLRIGSKSLFG